MPALGLPHFLSLFLHTVLGATVPLRPADVSRVTGVRTSWRGPLNVRAEAADTSCMMISHEQARLAATALKGGRPSTPLDQGCHVSEDVIRAAFHAATTAPDFRADRVAEARRMLETGMPDSHMVAEKMLSRIVGDSLR